MESLIKPEDIEIRVLPSDDPTALTRKYIVIYGERRVNLLTTEGNRFIKRAWRRLVSRFGEIRIGGADLAIEFDAAETATCITLVAPEGSDVQVLWEMIEPHIKWVLVDHLVGLYPRSPWAEKIAKAFPRSRTGFTALRRDN